MKIKSVEDLNLTEFDLNHWTSFYKQLFIEKAETGPYINIQATLEFLNANGYKIVKEEGGE